MDFKTLFSKYIIEFISLICLLIAIGLTKIFTDRAAKKTSEKNTNNTKQLLEQSNINTNDITGGISSIKDDIQSMNSRIELIGDKFSNIDDKFNIINEKFDSVKGKFDTIDMFIDKLDNDITVITQNIDKIKTDNGGLDKNCLDNINERLDQLDTRITTVQEKVNTLGTDLSTIKKELQIDELNETLINKLRQIATFYAGRYSTDDIRSAMNEKNIRFITVVKNILNNNLINADSLSIILNMLEQGYDYCETYIRNNTPQWFRFAFLKQHRIMFEQYITTIEGIVLGAVNQVRVRFIDASIQFLKSFNKYAILVEQNYLNKDKQPNE